MRVKIPKTIWSFCSFWWGPLHCHLDSATVFIGASSKIQNDLIQSVADIMTEATREEVRNTPFVSIMVDKTTDISNTAQYVICPALHH